MVSRRVVYIGIPVIHCLCIRELNFAPGKATHANFCVFSALLLFAVWIVLVVYSLRTYASLCVGRSWVIALLVKSIYVWPQHNTNTNLVTCEGEGLARRQTSLTNTELSLRYLEKQLTLPIMAVCFRF